MELLQNLFAAAAADLTGSAGLCLRMLVACLCGACVGLERSRRQKDAGIRTHIMVALGSALMMIVSKYGFFDVLQMDSISLDASRIAANVITGVGFLGAGMIFIHNASIKGLTTAAGVWTTSGVGIAIGAGMYSIGICATVLIMILQFTLYPWFSRLENTANEFTILLKNTPDSVKQFRELLVAHNICIERCKMTRNPDGTILLDITIKKSRTLTMDELLLLAERDGNILSMDF